MENKPEKIRLIPDEWHIKHGGKFKDGRYFYADTQLNSKNRETHDFACIFYFDSDGLLTDSKILELGKRGAYTDADKKKAFDEIFPYADDYEETDIWIRPFSVIHEGIEFGFLVRSLEEEFGVKEYCVDFMPGNTLSFYPPWSEGGYDT